MNSLIPLNSFKNKKIVLLTHVGADVDAIAAAGALALFLKKQNKVVVGVPDHVSIRAKELAKRTNTVFKVNPSLQGADVLIMVDFNSWDMLGKMAEAVKNFPNQKYLIDHHSKSKDFIAISKNVWIDDTAVASCTLVHRWLKRSKAKIDRHMATLIACGVTADSAHFLIANDSTFELMAEMLRISGKRFSVILGLLNVEKDFSQKIATLKAAKRSRIFKMGDFIAVVAEVGAFESDAANALVKVGADVAFAGNNENRELKISARASQRIVKNAGLDLAKDVFQPLSSFFTGSGGGHSGAAGFNGINANPQQVMLKCIELCRKKLSKSGLKAQLKEYT